MTFERFEEHGRIGVLYSRGYGAGWSTWAGEDIAQQVAMDREVIEKWLSLARKPDDEDVLTTDSRKEFEEFLTEKFGDHFYPGGIAGLTLEMIPKGTEFRITEYDGYEQIEKKLDTNWWMA